MSASWDEHGLYKDNTPFSGGAIYTARFNLSPKQSKADTHYRVFFKHKNGEINSHRIDTIDPMNAYIKSTMLSDDSIDGYILCVWINGEYRECRHSKGWDTNIKLRNLPIT